MKTTHILLILIFSSFSLFAQEIEISGKLLSRKNQSPIPYASIVDITTYKAGTTSNEKGEFTLRIPEDAKNYEVLFSSIGYKDTIFSVQDLQEITKPILLIEDIQILNEIVITNKGYKEIDVGVPFGDIQNSNGGFSSSPGLLFGSYLKTKNYHVGLIKSVSLCISELGFPTAPFSIRLLAPKQKMKPNHIDPISDFSDILEEPIKVEAKGSGWMEIDLSKYNIALPKHGVYFLIIPLDYGDQFKWKTKDGKDRYGISVTNYSDDQKGVFYAFFHKGYGISYSDLTFQKVIPLAMAITYRREK